MLFGFLKSRPSTNAPPATVVPDPIANVRSPETKNSSDTKTAPGSARPGDRPDQALIDALVESRRRFKEIVEVSGDFAWETDAAGAFVFVSPGLTLGYRPEELIGAPATRFLAEGGAHAGETPFEARAAVRDVDIWLRARAGGDVCLSASAIPIVDDKGGYAGARGVCRDVTEERRQNAAFAALQRREAAMARIVRAASSELDPNNILTSALAETRDTLAADYADIRRPDEDGTFRLVVCAKDTEVEDAPVLKTVFSRMSESRTLVTAADSDWFHLCAPIIFQNTVIGALLVSRKRADNAFSDDERRFCDELANQFAILMAQVDSHRKLEEMARTDEMTGLLNRRAFLAELADRTARAGAGGSDGSLFYVDLDNFKAVNDVHGHQRGDEALIALADLLVTQSRPGDLVARLGGDEFAMWMDRTDTDVSRKRAVGLIAASRGLRIYSGAPDKPLGISVGVAVFHADGPAETVAELTARADSAMYDIKHGGKSGYVIADAATGPVSAASGDIPRNDLQEAG
jgi:diguanylate cyclase (GGDEF)-like protein/PAS domain S-box-containing protein